MTTPRRPSLLLALPHHSTLTWVLLALVAVLVLAVAAAFAGRALVRRGLREPRVVRLINKASERALDVVKRPITVAVLDEVADVLRTGHYTRNIAAALDENHVELKAMISEKVLADPFAQRSLGLLPFKQRLVEEIAEAGLRVVFEVLLDPRTDELVADVLRDNINQIRAAVVADER